MYICVYIHIWVYTSSVDRIFFVSPRVASRVATSIKISARKIFERKLFHSTISAALFRFFHVYVSLDGRICDTFAIEDK